MASRREVWGGLVALLLVPLTGGQALAQAPASSSKAEEKPAPVSLSSSLGLVVYPSKGQTPAKQQKDETECFTWAQQQYGVNPLEKATAAASAPAPAQGGDAAKGAAKGAVGGAAVGVITGHPGRGAAIGATGGAIAGGARKEKRQEQAQEAQEAQAQKAQQERATFNRAFGACLDGRGYSVK